ncbi:MAG: tetratricopeptide repeat protein [Deltaproteobacteria bacterium]|nr:tetratricopeptide repeat protein [Deltaproteobacteria bacterium]
MTTAELIKAGKLTQARQQLVQEVKASPADPGKRTTLCQVLCFCGEWDKAERHLDAICAQDPKRETGVQVYRNLIQAERERIDVLELRRGPAFLTEAPPWLDTYWSALERIAANAPEEAEPLFRQADAQRFVVSGTINQAPFTGIVNTDSRLSCFLEAFVHERYIWIPFDSVREMIISPPKTLSDLLWVPANITAWSGLAMNCYLPVLYAASSSHEDDRVRLGQMTVWQAIGGPFAKGSGQQVLQIGQTDMALLEIRELQCNPPPATDGLSITS